MASEKKLSFSTVILTVICVVFVAEAAAPAAAIGNQQFFWWIFLILTFLLPYGLICAELGTTYDGEGGLYDWVRNSLGDAWGARVSWYYWINFPLWMASLGTLFPDIISMCFGIEFGTAAKLAIELVFVWFVVFLSFFKVSDAEWILNGGAALKLLIAVSVGIMGIWFAMNHGFAGDMSASTFLPDLTSLNAIQYLSIIIFNFMGFEVVTTFASDMEDPKKDIPKAIILGGIAIAVVYLFAGFGIGAAIPAEDIDPDFGMIVAVQTMLGENSWIFVVISLIFLVTLFANMTSWSFGVNYVAEYGAKHNNMPSVFAIESKKTGMPAGAAIVNGVVATLALLLQLIPNEEISNGLFWTLFSVNVCFLLLAYIPVFPAFLKLREVDANRERPYKVPFKGALLKAACIIPAIELVLAIVATVLPLQAMVDGTATFASWFALLFMVAGIVGGEVMRVVCAKKRERDFNGLTPELADKWLENPDCEDPAELLA